MPKPNSDCRATERKHPWPMVRLGDVCEVISSRGHQIKQSEILPSGKYPVVSQSENPIEGFSDKEICIADVPIVLFGDHTCNVKLINDPFVVGADGTKLLKPNSHCVQYLYYCLQLLVLKLQDGKYRRHFGDLCDSEIPLPPLSVQREIVARLERELAAVEKMKKGFEALAETAKAEFKAERLEAHKKLLCGKWPCEPLKKHVDVLAGYAFQSQGFVESGIRICGGLIIAPDRIKWEECKYWKSSNGIEQYLLHENDLVIALDRPWISGGFKMGVICKQDLPCLLIQRTARLRIKDVDFRYVMMLLRDESFKLHCATSGTTVPHISHKDVETYEIPFPPARVQKEIVDRLSAAKTRAEKLEAKAREGVAVCETMRKAILKEAFDSGR